MGRVSYFREYILLVNSALDYMLTVTFRRRTQVGIVFGFLVNLLFGMWRYLLDTS